MLTEKKKVRIIDSTWTLIVSFLFIGPLMLPLLWRNPRFSIKSKIFWSILIIAFTAFLIISGQAFLLSIINKIQ